MSFRDYLPFVVFIALFYATLVLFFKIFLGHYGTVARALLAVLVVLTSFVHRRWITSIVAVQDRIVREAIRIQNQL